MGRRQEAHVDGYLTDILSERAADVHPAQGERRAVFLSVHYSAPHWPWETRDDRAEAERIKSLFHLDGGSVEIYQRMIHHMDEGIGRILQAVNDTGGRDNTLVLFTSDNGAERFSDTWPLVGKKMDLLEGGIRVPYVVRWPERIKPKTVSKRVVMGMDWMPTFLAAAGAKPHPDYPLDGVDVFGPDTPRQVFWRMKFEVRKPCARVTGSGFAWTATVPVQSQERSARARESETPGAGALRRTQARLFRMGRDDATHAGGCNIHTCVQRGDVGQVSGLIRYTEIGVSGEIPATS